MTAGVVKDQEYFEDLLYDAARDFDLLHGTARVGLVCELDYDPGCPNGDIDAPVTVTIESDWRPTRLRLDLTLPIFGTEINAAEMDTPGYVKLGRFPGLVFQPGAIAVCDGEAAIAGWPNFHQVFLTDDMIDSYGIDHEGLQEAIEHGIDDGSAEVSELGSTHQINCGPQDQG